MARSLKIKPDCQQKAKNALRRNGFPSQNALALALGISRATVSNFLNGKAVDYLNAVEICEKLGLDWQEVAEPPLENEEPESETVFTPHIDLENAPDVSLFYGRTKELADLERWIVQDNCRLIGLYGFGGIGKTTLAITLAQKIQNQFQFVIWRSLRDAPSVQSLLEDLIKVLSNQQETELLESIEQRISHLISYLRQYRCLLILDNAESLMQQEGKAGYFREEYKEYRELLKQVGELSHRSCVILTSRENSQEIIAQAGQNFPVRSLKLNGLNIEVIKQVLANVCSFDASEEVWQELIQRYSGNPKLLIIAATEINDLFRCSIESFLKQTPFNGQNELIREHVDRLSEVEKDLIYWLAINREPVNLSELKQDFLPSVEERIILESLRSLIHRSVIETFNPGMFSLPPIIMEYMTNRLIEEVCEELRTGKISILNRYALMMATSKNYIRDIQERFLLEPIKNRLLACVGNKQNLEKNLKKIIEKLSNESI